MGRGHAPEAARALAGFGLTAPEVQNVSACAELSRQASVRVLEKAGVRRYADKGDPARFGMTRER
ncbi:GNAT family N-acetyltransferase [Streptomyces sp. NPDC001339]|uniref:GNAT family N-acetyltransferase n=1 Tax=Streptomyces sp. NPDC001339 TaxID=3364563 RepID=UPI0036B126CB